MHNSGTFSCVQVVRRETRLYRAWKEGEDGMNNRSQREGESEGLSSHSRLSSRLAVIVKEKC